MPTDLIRYDLMVQEALKGVVRKILIDAARDGLPGEHHFYVSFRTDHSGVRLSPRLREKYPRDMTIVLQHQFENLTVSDTGFEVGLSFSGVAERLKVPFESLTGFFDPSVQFGLKFELSETAEDGEDGEEAPAAKPIPIAPAKKSEGKSAVPRLGPRKIEPSDEGKTGAGERKPSRKAPAADGEPQPGAQVVSLDSFRKKN